MKSSGMGNVDFKFNLFSFHNSKQYRLKFSTHPDNVVFAEGEIIYLILIIINDFVCSWVTADRLTRLIFSCLNTLINFFPK